MKHEHEDDDLAAGPDADPFERELARVLSSVRYDVEHKPLCLPADDRVSTKPARGIGFALCLSAAAVVLAWIGLRATRAVEAGPDAGAFEIVDTSGDVDWSPARHLECRAGGVAHVRVGSIGTLELSERSRLVLEQGGADGYRVFLERGSLTASIFAAPRLFAVGTPGGLAVDLGCVYRAHVEEDGATRIEVVRGRVSFESAGVHALVPSGAECRARPGRGIGLPRWSDAGPALCAALERVDSAGMGTQRASAIRALLAAGESRDALTIFHLLERAESGEREPIVARLESWVPIPATTTRAQLVAGEPEALRQWRDALRSTW